MFPRGLTRGPGPTFKNTSGEHATIHASGLITTDANGFMYKFLLVYQCNSGILDGCYLENLDLDKEDSPIYVNFSPSGYMSKEAFGEWIRFFLDELGFTDIDHMPTKAEWDEWPYRMMTLDKHFSHMVEELDLLLRHKFVVKFILALGSIPGQPNDNGSNFSYVTVKKNHTEKYNRSRIGATTKAGLNSPLHHQFHSERNAVIR